MQEGLNPDEWKSLTTEQRIERCRALATKAQELADKATGQLRKDHLIVTTQWLQLATDFEKNEDRLPRRR
jgi:hypothetical protein